MNKAYISWRFTGKCNFISICLFTWITLSVIRYANAVVMSWCAPTTATKTAVEWLRLCWAIVNVRKCSDWRLHRQMTNVTVFHIRLLLTIQRGRRPGTRPLNITGKDEKAIINWQIWPILRRPDNIVLPQCANQWRGATDYWFDEM